MRHGVVMLLLASLGAAQDRPVCRKNSNCNYNSSTPNDGIFYYTVDGIEVKIIYQAETLFYLKCLYQSMSVNNTNLPAMEKLQKVEKVEIINCKAPLNVSYADALKAMNFSVTKSLLLRDTSQDPRLDHQHFANLSINELSIIISKFWLQPAEDYLDGLSELRSLKLQNVIPEPKALMQLPEKLEVLRLCHANLSSLAWIERLSSLRELNLTEGSATKPLKNLKVPKLESLPYLTTLRLSYIPLDTDSLASKLKGSSIKQLVMRSCNLTNLPNKTFEGANLTSLELSYNNLTVQERVFSPLQWLTYLDLEKSQVDSADLVNILSSLGRLEELKAVNNPLSALCDDTDISSNLTWPKSLRNLDLSSTNVTRICPDWTDNDALLDVNLSDNDITYLNYNDLKMKRAEPTAVVTIDLTDNPSLRIINVSSADIEQCRKGFTFTPDSNNRQQQRTNVILKLSDSLSEAQCDYDAYMLHAAVCDSSWLKFNKDIFASIRSKYTSPKRNEILCQYSGTCLPDCLCSKRPSDNVTVVQQCKAPLPQTPCWPQPLLEYPLALHVESGILDRVPDAVLVELYASHNNITDLNNLPDTLLELDIRYNKIRHISEEVARNLSKIGTNRAVYLEGNRLACNCSDAPALELLKHVVQDLNKTQCADEVEVWQKMQFLNDQCAFPVRPILFGLLSIILVLLAVWLLLHRFKPQIRQVLFKLNWGRRYIFRVKDDDAEKTVDVFLSYAYCDLEVLKELKNGLESRGYSTLEHNRDWHPGVPILDQIVVSVKCARRTLLLVSDNYADSRWTVQEFHAAHTHAMERQTARVLVVRYNLQQSERLPPDLQNYLKYNTYLDWHDVNFWEKLCMAMPMRFQISN